MISTSVAASKAEVASSHNRNGASFIIARAIETLCFSPPDSFRPLSPTFVFKPSGNWVIKCSSWAALTTSLTSFSSEFKLPY
mmetsp:Transcript_16121/g.18263  ORF Transcript_16121/g.18263 Transcript_16121/m.18263 type:complete len:82 (+) Transcript_16121:254-499(+)